MGTERSLRHATRKGAWRRAALEPSKHGDPGRAVQRGGCSVVALVLVVTFASALGAGGAKRAILSGARELVVACKMAHRALDESSVLAWRRGGKGKAVER